MKNAAPSRHGRLALLCVCSAALHLALLEWAARHNAAAVAAPPSDATLLSVRLRPPGVVTPPAAVPGAVTRPPRPAPAPSPPTPRLRPGATAAGAPAAADAVRTVAPGDAAAADPGTPSLQMPGSYNVRMPPSAVLTYAVVRRAGDAVLQSNEAARLTWRTDGNRYLLEMDGVLGHLHSAGQRGDSGVLPRTARDDTDGAGLVTEFDGRHDRVLFRGTGRDAPGHEGIQDRASLLLQLAGMGLANPDQLQGNVQVVVADTRELRIARFRTLALEDIATGEGTLAAWHVVEQVAPGAARLEVWLAPARDWLPVQLRVVQPDGASVTQTLTTMTMTMTTTTTTTPGGADPGD
jgi:hypothetical protein